MDNMQRVTVNTKKENDSHSQIGGADVCEEIDADLSQPQLIYSKTESSVDQRNINRNIPKLRRVSSLSYLGSSMVDLFRLPSGSLRASVFTIISGCVGGGTLTLSYGIYMAGTLPSLFYLIMSTLFQVYTAYVLVYCSAINECKTFRKLSILLYNKSFATFIQCNELLLLWCIAISYMTFSKNLLGPAVQNLIGKHNKWYANGIVLLSILLFTIITPLALKRKITALRYSSLFGFCAVAFTVIVVVILYFDWCNDNTTHDSLDNPDRYCIFSQFSKTINNTKLIDSSFLNHTYTIAVMVGGYCVQPTILPIYYGIKNQTPDIMIRGLIYSFIVVFVLYVFVAYCGYFTFPDTVGQNLLTSNYGNNTLVLIAQIALSVYVVMVIPLFAHAFRSSMKGLILSRQQTQDTVNVALVNDNGRNNTKKELSLNQHIFVTLLYLYTAYGVAVVADNIGTVNSLISSTTMPVVSFFFPACVVWKTKQASKLMIWITVMICVTMIANSILQLIRQIIAWVE